jgi:uncharacterized protein (TIGR02679 family)
VAREATGSHVILTLGQLSAEALSWPTGVACFSCENPSVLIAAERALGATCPPVVCTGGRPSDAVRLLFGAVAGAGGAIRHHGDFDAAGVQILRDLEQRYDAQPWRFDLVSWRRHRMRMGLSAGAQSAATLEEVVDERSLPEELVIGELLDDLRAQGS